MSQLTDRVNKISDELTDMEALNGKLSDLKAMMKDIWKHQRRKAKKQKQGATSEEGRERTGEKEKDDATKTEDETFDDTTAHTQTYEGIDGDDDGEGGEKKEE